MSRYVLIVDDERPLREMLSFMLRRSGFEIATASSAEEAQATMSRRCPDLCLIDWKLPGASGLELTKLLRSEIMTRRLPIIMVSAKIEEPDRVAALDAGADDYVIKPFSHSELLARINALLRRCARRPPVFDVSSDLVLDSERCWATLADQRIELRPKDFQLLEFFVHHPERVYSRHELLHEVWGGEEHARRRTVDVQVLRLRKELEAIGYEHCIQTVRGSGYRFSTRT